MEPMQNLGPTIYHATIINQERSLFQDGFACMHAPSIPMYLETQITKVDTMVTLFNRRGKKSSHHFKDT